MTSARQRNRPDGTVRGQFSSKGSGKAAGLNMHRPCCGCCWWYTGRQAVSKLTELYPKQSWGFFGLHCTFLSMKKEAIIEDAKQSKVKLAKLLYAWLISRLWLNAIQTLWVSLLPSVTAHSSRYTQNLSPKSVPGHKKGFLTLPGNFPNLLFSVAC